MGKKRLFFDIETEGNEEVIPLLPMPTAPSNYKNPDKIKAYIDSKALEQVDLMALDPDHGKVRAISYRLGVEGKTEVLLVSEGGLSEDYVVQTFWDMFAEEAGGYSCGYNILNFDFPYLQRRSMDLGIQVRHLPALAKYRMNPTRDLFGILFNWGRGKKLKWVCKRYGIKYPKGWDEQDGSMVADMSDEELVKYAAADVDVLVELHDKMTGVYWI